ncbi:MAG: hypothetical protein J2P17_20550, partial [Mycobacterium sp.]|nr:hypothetical protein [Mycobacterium sp.]
MAPGETSGSTSLVTSRVLTRITDLEPLSDSWDALAVELGRPRSTPAWVLAWYRAVMPRDAEIRVIVVWVDAVLAAVAPLFVRRNRLGLFRYEMAGANTLVGVEPLICGRLADVAGPALALAFTQLRPVADIVHLECVRGISPLLCGVEKQWSARRATVVSTPSSVAHIDLADGHEG